MKDLIDRVLSGKLFYLTKLFIDASTAVIALFLSFELRLDGQVTGAFAQTSKTLYPYLFVGASLNYWIFQTHRLRWRFSSIRDLLRLSIAQFVLAVIFFAPVFFIFKLPSPRSIPIIFWIIGFLGLCGSRLILRIFYEVWKSNIGEAKRILIVGAGNAGEMIVRQMRREPYLGYKPIVLVDDDKRKQGSIIHGVSVIGSVSNLPQIAKEKDIDEIIIATPSAEARQRRQIVEYCEKSGVKFKTLPGPREIIDGIVTVDKIREVQIEDLLERVANVSDFLGLQECFQDKVVLVTGAAGSIGSELCRQLAKLAPKMLVMLDRAESDVFDLEHEIKRIALHKERMVCVIADINQLDRLKVIFNDYKPDIVFHAAAYKHVPLMQSYPDGAVINNVFGTINVSMVSAIVGAQRFVLISTDKAVNPTSVMGATKRITELYCVSQNGKSQLKHVVVRFGNVLDSKGSVIPLFKRQIQDGGPITLTSKEITRFFMTIPEAVELVLQAGVMGEGGEIFILDMGEPVKVYDMAKHLVTLSGLELGKDIDIEIIGLRPGEKLYEELWHDDEMPIATDHPKILKSSQVSCNGKIEEHFLSKLRKVAESGRKDKIIEVLQEMVPTFRNDDR